MQKGAFVTYAYCDKHEPGLSVKSKADMIQSFSNGSVTARCPSGSEAVSGGFHSPKGGPTGQTLFAYASKRVGDRKWRVSVVSNDGMNANKLTVFAYCDKRQPGLVSRSKQTTVTAGDSVSLTVRCKNGGEPFSGGYESTLDTTTGVDTAFAFTSRRTSSSTWKVSAFGNAGGTTPTVTAFAYCKR
jgi:hypothetical protein